MSPGVLLVQCSVDEQPCMAPVLAWSGRVVSRVLPGQSPRTVVQDLVASSGPGQDDSW